jgi:polyisoprenoid-binding protein YceI
MSSTAVAIPTGTWQVDPVHSTVGFKVRHFGVSWFRGKFQDVSGSITTDENGIVAVEGRAAVASIDVENPQLNGHLQTADFFDVENHPELSFASRRVERLSADRFRIVGDLTLRGVTDEVVLEAEIVGSGDDPYGNTRIGLSAQGEIDRTRFGITWNQPLENGGVILGDTVKLAFDVEAVLGQE